MFTDRLLRARGHRVLNNLDAKCMPVSRLDGDQWLELTPPYVTPPLDPGIGANASASIAVITPSGAVPVLPDGTAAPAGWSWPRPALTGSETWYPLGNHGQGRWSFSERYGPILNATTCLYRDGSVKMGAAAFANWRSAREGKWWVTLGNLGNILAWDSNRGTDLVAAGNDLYALDEAVFPPRLGAKVASLPFEWMAQPPQGSWHIWDDWNAFSTHRVFLPWVNELWTVQAKQGASADLPVCIWWVKCDGSNACGEIAIPASVAALWSPDNLAFTADADNKRVVAAQSQRGASVPEDETAKFPLALWEITGPGANAVWVKSDLITQPVLCIGAGRTGRTPLQHIGHDRFMFLAPRVPFWAPAVTVDADGRKRVSEGYGPIEIQLPGPKPRKLTVKTYDCSGWNPSSTAQHAIGKHSRWAYRPVTGEVIQFGGDFRGFPQDDSYRQDMYALIPSNPSSHRRVQPFDLPASQGPVISRPDECGWVWDETLDVGYAVRGMFASTGTTTGNTFVPKKVAIYDPKLPDHRWSEMVLNGSGPWPTFENGRHANWDPQTRRIVRVADSAATLCVNRVDVDARIYDATLIGSTTNSRPADADLSAMGSILASEYTALDPATGIMYAHDWLRGYLYAIDTRAATPTMSWVCRTNAQASSENETFLTWVAGLLLMIIRMSSGRARVYSWQPGETGVIEHPVPPNTRVNQLVTFGNEAFGLGSVEGPGAAMEYYVFAFS